MNVRELLCHVTLELHIPLYRVRLADNMAEVDLDAGASLLHGDVIIIENAEIVRDPRGGKQLTVTHFYKNQHTF